MKELQLTQGKVALVSDHRFEHLNQWKWYACKMGNKWYARRKEVWGGKSIILHRYIMGVTDPNILVDHIDGDGLNCQDENMRLCTQAENLRNRGKTSKNTSGYKGVTWNKHAKKFNASITVKGLWKHLGLFTDAQEAARAYDQAAREYFGEFARPNLQG